MFGLALALALVFLVLRLKILVLVSVLTKLTDLNPSLFQHDSDQW